MKIRIDQADKWFSLYIRTRDGWRCKRCSRQYLIGSAGLQCSHFVGRRKENTRFLPLNCDALCAGCHQYFTANPYEHTQWQIHKKGQKEIDHLIMVSNLYCKKDRKLMALVWKKAYEDLKKEQDGRI